MNESKNGFIKLLRNDNTTELLKHPKEFMLLTQIAYRAKRTISNIGNLNQNEALIGDCKSIGLSQQSYRSAKSNIQKWGLATFKPTNKGTIATLTNKAIYDINIEQTNNQDNNTTTDKPTNKQQTSNKQATTNKNDKNDKNDKNKKNTTKQKEEIPPLFYNIIDTYLKLKISDETFKDCSYLKNYDRNKWAEELYKLKKIDGYNVETIRSVLDYSCHDPFWCNQIVSLAGIRKKGSNGLSKFENCRLSIETQKNFKTKQEEF